MSNMVQQTASCSGTAIKMVRVEMEMNKTAPLLTSFSPYYSSHVQPLQLLHTLYLHQESEEQAAQESLWITGANGEEQ